jgi:hypothetical protein
MIWPPIRDVPSIGLRTGDIVHDGAVDILLTPGEPTVLLDEAHLAPAEARALSLALGEAYSAAIKLPRDEMPIELRENVMPSGITVGALITGDVLTLYLLAGDERKTLWTGPTEHALSLMLALSAASAGAVAIVEYAQNPLYIVSPIPPDNRTAFSPRWTGHIC